jgi:hypothetical protein
MEAPHVRHHQGHQGREHRRLGRRHLLRRNLHHRSARRAMKDINGRTIKRGCKVRRARWGIDIIPSHRRLHPTTVTETKHDEYGDWVLVANDIGWAHPDTYEVMP